MASALLAAAIAWTPCPHVHLRGAQLAHRSASRHSSAAGASRGACVLMQEEGAELLYNPNAWTEASFAAAQSLPSVCRSVNQNVAEAEHMALAMLGDDKSTFSRVLTAAGASPLEIKASFQAYARSQPQVFSQDSTATSNINVGSSLLSLLQRASAQRKLLTDDFLSSEHLLLALLSGVRLVPGAARCAARRARCPPISRASASRRLRRHRALLTPRRQPMWQAHPQR